MRILAITDRVPYPLTSGGPLRTYSLLERIAREHEVTLATLVETPEEREGVARLQKFLHRVETAPFVRQHWVAHLPGLFRFALAGRPLELKFGYSAELARKVRELATRVPFDVIEIEQSPMALYLEHVPPDLRHRSVLVFHDILFNSYDRVSRLERRPRRRLRAALYSRMMRSWEPSYAGNFSACIAMSEPDRQLLLAANPRLRVEVAPNGVDTRRYQLLPPPSGGNQALLFIGKMSYMPNTNAALFFHKEVLPIIRRSAPGVELWIVGTDPPPEITALDGDDVHVTGRVEEILPYYARTAVSVVPIKAGGGTRLKILESMALGRPVVSTTVGCEGLDVIDGQHLLVADDPQALADRTLQLLHDQNLYNRIVATARDLVRNRYDWDAVARKTLSVFEDVAAREPARRAAHLESVP